MLFKFDWKIGRSWHCCYGFWNAKSTFVELNMATTIKTPDWWLDCGVTVHVRNDEAQYTKYDEMTNTSY